MTLSRHRTRDALTISFLFMLVVAQTAAAGAASDQRGDAADWPRWRGPRADGISSESSWATARVADLKIAWQAKVGVGFSGVSVVGNRLYTMGYGKGQDSVLCLDAASGRQVWSYSYPSNLGDYPGPRVTPTVDGDRVYSLGQFGQLVCLDRARGSLIWSRHLATELGAGKPTWGFAGSPVVWGNLLLLNAGRSGLALDKESGKLVWGAPGTGGYATIVVFSAGGKELLAVFGEKALYGVDPQTGAVSWSFPWVTANDVNAADPLVVGDRLFITSDYGNGCALLAVKPGAVEPVWQNTNVSSHFSSALYLNGAIFANDGDANARRGSFVCLDPATGSIQWSEMQGVGSLLGSGDRIFLLNERGQLRVAEASAAGYREMAKASLPIGLYWNMPVLVAGRLYIRSLEGNLFCLDLRP